VSDCCVRYGPARSQVTAFIRHASPLTASAVIAPNASLTAAGSPAHLKPSSFSIRIRHTQSSNKLCPLGPSNMLASIMTRYRKRQGPDVPRSGQKTSKNSTCVLHHGDEHTDDTLIHRCPK